MYRVMLVDDEPWALVHLQKIVQWEELGFQIVMSCTSGEEAIEQVENANPDVIFADIHMVEMTGIELMQRVRKTNKDIIFVIVSAYQDFDAAREALELGVVKYILKPIDEKEVRETLLAIKDKLEDKYEYVSLESNYAGETIGKMFPEEGFSHCYVSMKNVDKNSEGITVLNVKIQEFPSAVLLRSRRVLSAEGISIGRKNFCDINKMVVEAKYSKDYGIIWQQENELVAKVQFILIDEHADSEILAKIPKRLFISDTYIREQFLKYEGVTPGKFLKEIRIKAACTLLSTTKDTIRQISAEVGYGDYNYFSRIFKKKTGFTPEEYRKLNSR